MDPKRKNRLFAYIPQERTLNLNFDFFHLFALNRDLPHYAVSIGRNDGVKGSVVEDRRNATQTSSERDLEMTESSADPHRRMVAFPSD